MRTNQEKSAVGHSPLLCIEDMLALLICSGALGGGGERHARARYLYLRRLQSDSVIVGFRTCVLEGFLGGGVCALTAIRASSNQPLFAFIPNAVKAFAMFFLLNLSPIPDK